ncbi:MAG: hypothetical protein Q4C70_12015 [Planctomycetia bacterium]|nr:hypothetical protein [Planctomycetia bacterium]
MLKNNTFRCILTLSLGLILIGTFLPGCKKSEPEPMSRLEYLEKDIQETQAFIDSEEAKYKENRGKLSASGDKAGVKLLDMQNKERLVNERRILKMKQNELEKLRKAEAKANK